MVSIARGPMEQVDARNLLCPMPVIRMQQKIARLPPGTEVDLVCTDPGALQDVPAWCRVHGHHLVRTEAAGDEIHIVVRVGVRHD